MWFNTTKKEEEYNFWAIGISSTSPSSSIVRLKSILTELLFVVWYTHVFTCEYFKQNVVLIE